MIKFKIFPCDSDTLEIIKEIETCLGSPNKNTNDMSKYELVEYINKLIWNTEFNRFFRRSF